MDDHGMPRGSALDRVEPMQRVNVLRVATQAIDGLGGKSDETTALQHADGRGDVSVGGHSYQ